MEVRIRFGEFAQVAFHGHDRIVDVFEAARLTPEELGTGARLDTAPEKCLRTAVLHAADVGKLLEDDGPVFVVCILSPEQCKKTVDVIPDGGALDDTVHCFKYGAADVLVRMGR